MALSSLILLLFLYRCAPGAFGASLLAVYALVWARYRAVQGRLGAPSTSSPAPQQS